MKHEKYYWKNFQTAQNLSVIFQVGKRRILQVIKDLKEDNVILEAILIFPKLKTEELVSSRVYMRLDS